MSDIIGWIAVGVAGMALGAFFFGGLWWTVKSSVSSPRPGLLVFASLLLRLGITLAGFYLVADDHWQPLVACLLGFVVARVVIVQFLAPWLEQRVTVPEITHAP
jgi:F1F0 ATPase subunit 2